MRAPTSASNAAVAASGGGDNWSRNLTSGTYDIYFDHTDAGAADAGTGLSDSSTIAFTVAQLNPGACP